MLHSETGVGNWRATYIMIIYLFIYLTFIQPGRPTETEVSFSMVPWLQRKKSYIHKNEHFKNITIILQYDIKLQLVLYIAAIYSCVNLENNFSKQLDLIICCDIKSHQFIWGNLYKLMSSSTSSDSLCTREELIKPCGHYWSCRTVLNT